MTHTLFTSPLELHSMNGWDAPVASLNVKVRRTSPELAALISDDEQASGELSNAWWSTATMIADELGFGVEQDGRSGGWLVFTLDGARLTHADLDTAGLDAIEGNAPRALARRLERAAVRIADTLTQPALLELAIDLGLEGAVVCDACGGPCDAADAVTDDCVNLCGGFYGNGCADDDNDAGAMLVDGVFVARVTRVTI
jgi:hypothetical protein